jgi:hypothetical protein
MPFGGSDGLVCLLRRDQVLPRRGMAFAHYYGGGWLWSEKAIMALPAVPRRPVWQGKRSGSASSHFGAEMRSPAFSALTGQFKAGSWEAS